jgi:tetratricopeptide (TPR) repeat protein
MGENNPIEITEQKTRLLRELEDLRSKVTCAYCAHRRPKKLCGSPRSSHFETEVGLTDTCDSFDENPAQLTYIRAIFIDKNGDNVGLDTSEIVKAFNEAIEGGLPADDELYARFCIAKRLVLWINEQDLDPMQRSKLRETEEAIREFELALVLDHEGGFGFFEEVRGRLLLSQLDLMYAVEGGIRSIENARDGNASDAAALEYWESKLPRCDYLSTNPLILTLVQAGHSYSRIGKKDEAIKCFRLAADAAPVNISEKQEFEEDNKREAQICLAQLTQPQQVQPPTVVKTTEKACFIATAVYGEGDAPEVEALRYFRDNYLAQTPLTRWLVRTYYTFSPSIASVIRRNRTLRSISKACLDVVVRALSKTLSAAAVRADTDLDSR